ncbi:ABC transporter permease [Deinococcus peraridilitoris]|uniref:ABC-type nitrate/sulfonate/bicarbonate transport system, permease component n=1 Tax=Deinococcus peraridilitoris (strain DSM 19664 / LMG 22246 / CIP 109416 / KR-200) TaxID=937777 RepID=L0A1P8_DEIPD|nr:ABC transporter permease [Deinococcus peraridilitoris]AFZ67761.1 ABC-type nitrate/sulfonate/bicarbonate transport system, permease component [Deinococcus peraridilitoris DSM 19664]
MTVRAAPGRRFSPRGSNLGPMLVVALVVLFLYWPLMLWVNAGQAARALESGADLGCATALSCATQLRNPVLPAPGQLAQAFKALSVPPLAPTSAPYNTLVTAGETLVGLAIASVLGVLLALFLVVSRGFERAVLPWLIASQTVPIIALAPMLAVVLGQYGVQGWLPKALIASYIAFFPVAVGVARGLRSPDPLQLDLMRTYNAPRAGVFWKLQLPASVPFLFTALKVAATSALIGSIVAEISTISFSGLGKMLAENSRASDTLALWTIMFYGAALGIGLVAFIGLLERWVTPWRAGQPK